MGLGAEEKWTTETTPAAIAKNTTVFPWGTAWPPPPGTGNYSDETRRRRFPTTGEYVTGGYDDGFFSTAPVMSFGPNKLGIYDLSGNVHEWVEDWFDGTHKGHASRGGSWQTERSICHRPPCNGFQCGGDLGFGFRCVLERRPTFHANPPAIVEKARPPKFPKTMTPEQVAKGSTTNSLGMKLVPIPGTDILFCIHETRRKDYAAFDHEVPQTGSGLQWKTPRVGDVPTGMEDDDPVSSVSWDEAQSFCAWLTKKEKNALTVCPRTPSGASRSESAMWKT